jgi:pseudouridine-5'-phosphate glycosidase
VTLVVSDDVAMAVAAAGPVVALETSVIGQGLPHPRNQECIERMDGAIRAAGAVPAWTGIVDGAIRAGLDHEELRRFAESGEATKVARRDIPVAVATGALGATTVSATIWTGHRAGIAVAATGGIGGVHPGAHADVSADLLELARTPVLLVCSGAKSIVDPVLTAEKLEELGVALVGYGVDRLPFFLAREAPVELEHRVDTPDEAAAIGRAQRECGVRSAVLVCNPIPVAQAMDANEVIAATRAAEERAVRERVAGKALTPFLLAALADETGGRSLASNLALLEDNARVAAEIAVALSAARSG